MGRDNSPKERQRRELERKRNQRASYDRILIVSEGSKTEPNYFNEIRTVHRLHTANVVVRPCEFGTAPIQVVQYAKQLFEMGDPNRRIQARGFERVFAVFDRDEHTTYFDALNLAQSLDGRLRSDTRKFARFQAIASVPSFELWLLLHYTEILSPLHRNEVFQRLCQHFPGYGKGADNAFSTTCDLLPAAIQRAEALASRFNAYSDPEPFTGIVELVKLLTGLRGQS